MDYTYLSGSTNIVALHRVLPDAVHEQKLVEVACMELQVSKLRKYILDLRHAGYQFISLDEALLSEAPKGAKRIALTFDDGYIDFYEVILPLLEDLNVPACLYLVTGYPDQTCYHCFGILEDFVAKTDFIKFSWRARQHQYECHTREQKKATLLALDAFIESQINGVADVRELFESMGVSADDIFRVRALDWEKASELHRHPLVTIGSHTLSHPRLSQLTLDEARREINQSKFRLEEKLGSRINHFSYPYGDYSRDVVELVMEAGYLTATTVKSGHYDGGDRFTVNRYWLDSSLNPVE
ncbi:polysaccharide deacetylase family protein [Microbulbifer aggregans]|uniref:polysaccharide deacetylase family protein n=1 Tax=Microbulbifer aggregans TaxID=1769779 RepID=UPI001CFDA807|nr:polysaccharide deacetylase family protein [Microbulbifer aggregans]